MSSQRLKEHGAALLAAVQSVTASAERARAGEDDDRTDTPNVRLAVLLIASLSGHRPGVRFVGTRSGWSRSIVPDPEARGASARPRNVRRDPET